MVINTKWMEWSGLECCARVSKRWVAVVIGNDSVVEVEKCKSCRGGMLISTPVCWVFLFKFAVKSITGFSSPGERRVSCEFNWNPVKW